MLSTIQHTGRESEGWSQQYTELLQALSTISLNVKAAEDLKTLIEKIVEHATHLLNASGGGLYLSFPERREVLFIACYAINRDFTGTILKFGEGAAGKVAQTGKPMLVDHYHSWEGRSQAFETEEDFRGLLCVPMLWHGEVTGVLSIIHTEEGRSFSEADIQRIRPFADYAAVSLEYARLLEVERQRRREAEILHNASAALTSSLDLHDVLESFLTHLRQLVPFDSSSIFLTEDEGRVLRVAACRGFPDPTKILQATFPAGDTLSKRILQDSRAIIIDDVEIEPNFSKWGDCENIHGWMGIPLIGRGQIIGYVTCDHHKRGIYTRADAALAEAIAGQAALAIDNAHLFEAERTQLLLAQTLQKVGALLTTELGLQEVLDQILELLRRVVQFDCAAIHLIDEKDTIQLAAGLGFPDYEQARQVVRQLSSHILETKWQIGAASSSYAAIVIPDTTSSNLWKQPADFLPIRSWVGAPLLVKGRFIGSLNVDSLKVNAYNDSIAETVMAFANQAAAAIENARLFETARKNIAGLEALHQASLSLTASLDEPQVFTAILRATLDLLPDCENAHIFIYREDDERMIFGAAMNRNGVMDKPISEPRQNGLTYSVARNGRPIIVPEMHAHYLYQDVKDRWVGAIIGLPLKIGAHVVGVMNIKYSQSHQFSIDETHILKLLADQAAIAIEKARLFEQAAIEHRHLSLLYDIGRGLTSSLDVNEILQRAITLTCKALDGTMGQGFLYVLEEDRLYLQALYSIKTSSRQEVNDKASLRPGVGLVGWAIEHRQAVLVPDVTQDSRWLTVPGIDEDVRSALCAPILQGNEVNPSEQRLLGAMSVFHTQERAFTIDQFQLMQAICREVGMALSNANRYQQVQRRLTESTLIQKLAQAFNQRLEFHILVEELVSQISLMLGYYQTAIFLKEGDFLVLKAFAGEENPLAGGPGLFKLPISQGIIGRVARSGQVAFIPDVSADGEFLGSLSQVGSDTLINKTTPIVSELAVPILRGAEVIGVINIQTNRPNQLTTQDRELIQVLAGQVSVALENAALYERLRLYAEDLEMVVAQRTDELAELYKLSQEIGYQLSYEDLLHLLVSHLHTALHSEIVVGYIYAGDHQALYVVTERPLSTPTIAQIRFLCQEAIREFDEVSPDTEQLVPEIIEAPGYQSRAAPISTLNAVMVSPVFTEQRAAGLLIAASEHEETFDSQQERLLTTFANQASTAMKHLEALLAAQQKQIESLASILVDHMPVGTVLLDAGLHIVVANPTAREILAILSPNSQDTPLKRLGALTMDELIASQNDPLPLEIVVEEPIRRLFAAQIRTATSPQGSQPMRSPESHQWALILRETTGERERQDRIQSQERLATVGQLAAGIAHDFNNILAAIQVYADLLLCDAKISAASLEKIKTIQQQVQRATSLIRQILDFSRQSIMDRSALDLLPFLKELDKMLVRILPETIRMELVYYPGSYWVNADPSRLQQALMNLVLNGRDAMPEGGILRFELRNMTLSSNDAPPFRGMQAGNWVAVSVSDSGSGIPVEARAHIFEPFFSTKPIGQGTGLGLAQVYGIIKQHDGFIDYQSEIGQGTRFVIYLPTLLLPKPQEPEIDQHAILEAGARHKYPEEEHAILLVEDDEAAREAISTLLSSMHFHVITASNGSEALHKFNQSPGAIDLVISDIVMPRMGGIALLSALKEIRPGVKVLFISGHPLEDQNQMLLEEKLKGNDIHWLQKPFLAKDFFQAIQSLLDNG